MANSELINAGFTCKGKFRRLRSDYSKQMLTPKSKPYVDSLVRQIIREQGYQADSVKPANLYDPSAMFEKLAKYAANSNLVLNLSDPFLSYGISKAFYHFSRPKGFSTLPPLSIQEIVGAIKMEKSAGAGYFGPKGENIQRGLTRMEDVISHRKAPNPCLAFTRTSAGNKTRLVWGYPVEMTMLESRFARPLIDYFLGSISPMCFGRSKFKIASDINFKVCTGEPGKIPYALDFSGFDSTIPAQLIEKAFEILSTWFDLRDRERFGWEKIVHYFIHTPIVMPDGNLYVGKKCGVPSGSYFTQLIDSIVNVILIFAISRKLGFDLGANSLLVLGDDSIFEADGSLSLHDIARALGSYGIKLNVEKSRIGQKHFLGSYWHTGISDIPISEIIEKAICPEHHRSLLYKHKSAMGRREEAMSVLYSYARQYASAYKLIDKNVGNKRLLSHQMRTRNSTEHARGITKARLAAEPGYQLVLSNSGLLTGLHI